MSVVSTVPAARDGKRSSSTVPDDGTEVTDISSRYCAARYFLTASDQSKTKLFGSALAQPGVTSTRGTTMNFG